MKKFIVSIKSNFCRIGKTVFVLVLILALFVLLSLCGIKKCLEKCDFLLTLNENLVFITHQIDKFWPLILAIIVAYICIKIKRKYSIQVTSVSIGGFSINVKNADKMVKANIRNYLNSKRSLFYIDLDHDNFYEVFDSYYNIYSFLREQIQIYDQASNSTVYQDLNDAFLKLNSFLTRYQSNYRRWYETQTKGLAEKDIGDLQKDYRHYSELCEAFHEINRDMQKLAKKYEINISKWTI